MCTIYSVTSHIYLAGPVPIREDASFIILVDLSPSWRGGGGGMVRFALQPSLSIRI